MLALSVGVLALPAWAQNVETLLRQARQLMERGDVLAARERINLALRAAPTSVEARELLGHSALRVGDAPTAARAFGDALRLGGRGVALHEGLALAQLGLGEPEQGIRDLPRAAGPDGARLALLVASAQSDRYDVPAALRELDRLAAQPATLPAGQVARRRLSVALRAFDVAAATTAAQGLDAEAGSDAVLYLQAAVALLRGQLADCERLLGKLLAQQPAHRPALYLQAGVALERQRPGPALTALEQVDGRASGDLLTRVIRLLGTTQQGRIATLGDDLARLEPLVLRVPTNRLRWRPQMLIAGALVLDGLGRQQESLRWWTLAARQPGSPVGKRLARMALGERLSDEALRWLGPSQGLSARDLDAQVLRAAALSLQGRLAQALELLRPIKTPAANLLAGGLLLMDGRLADAKSRLLPESNQPAAALALLHADLRSGQVAAARQRVDALLRRDPDHPAYLHAAALQAWLKGDAGRTELLLTQALAAAPTDVGIARSRVRLDVERGRYAAARSRLQALAQANPGHSELLMEFAALALREGATADIDGWLERAAAAARPGESRAALALIDRRLRAGDAAGALAAAQRSMSPQREGWIHHVVLAQVLEANGQLEAARRELVLAGRMVGYASDELATLAGLQVDLGDLDAARYTLHKALSDASRHAASLALKKRLDSGVALPRRSAKGQGLYGPAQLTAFQLDRWGRLGSLASLPVPDAVSALALPDDPQARLLQAWQDLALWTDNGPVSCWWLLAAMDRTDDGRPFHPAPSLQAQLEYLSEVGADGR